MAHNEARSQCVIHAVATWSLAGVRSPCCQCRVAGLSSLRFPHRQHSPSLPDRNQCHAEWSKASWKRQQPCAKQLSHGQRRGDSHSRTDTTHTSLKNSGTCSQRAGCRSRTSRRAPSTEPIGVSIWHSTRMLGTASATVSIVSRCLGLMLAMRPSSSIAWHSLLSGSTARTSACKVVRGMASRPPTPSQSSPYRGTGLPRLLRVRWRRHDQPCPDQEVARAALGGVGGKTPWNSNPHPHRLARSNCTRHIIMACVGSPASTGTVLLGLDWRGPRAALESHPLPQLVLGARCAYICACLDLWGERAGVPRGARRRR